MKSCATLLCLALAALLPCAPRTAAAVAVDGVLDAAYGAPLAVQTTQTNDQVGGDNTLGVFDYANGSELDEAYAFVSGGTLYLFFTGNLFSYISPSFPSAIVDHLEIFFDTKSGGQNTLLGNNPHVDAPFDPLSDLAGLTFDTGFAPDYWFGYHGGDIPGSPYSSLASYAELLTGGGGVGYDLGRGTAGGPGTLSGGTNPYGVLVTIDNRNVAGVTGGCGAASGAGVPTGIEWAIPLAAIGNPSGCVNVCAFTDYELYPNAAVSNQVLGPVPPGTCKLGLAPTVNFAAIPGPQFFTLCFGPTPTHRPTWGSVKAIYR